MADSYEKSHRRGCGHVWTLERIHARFEQILSILESSLPEGWRLADDENWRNGEEIRLPVHRTAPRRHTFVERGWWIVAENRPSSDEAFERGSGVLRDLGWFHSVDTDPEPIGRDPIRFVFAKTEDGFGVILNDYGPSRRVEFLISSPDECPAFSRPRIVDGLLWEVRMIFRHPYRERLRDPGLDEDIRESMERYVATRLGWRWQLSEFAKLPAKEWDYRKHRLAAWLCHRRADRAFTRRCHSETIARRGTKLG